MDRTSNVIEQLPAIIGGCYNWTLIWLPPTRVSSCIFCLVVGNMYEERNAPISFQLYGTQEFPDRGGEGVREAK